MDYEFKIGDVFEVVFAEDYDIFEVGDIVVCVENTDSIPFCVKYEDYVSGSDYEAYCGSDKVWSMCSLQLKRL